MPTFDENNVHHVEFEAPLSADSQTTSAAARRHFSIDLSLELERQLDMESLPPTPAHNADRHPRQDDAADAPSIRESLDPHVLAHIVRQLQQSLTDVQKDRDNLLDMVASAHSHEAELKDALQHMTDKATTMEIELSDARTKMKDDEDAISMLRTKVEESRRGLMRLQTESRRQSMAPMSIDMTRAGIPSFGSPPSSKRASFTPLTGGYTARPSAAGHRRISSVSDSAIPGASDLSTSPNSLGLALPDSRSGYNPPPVSSRRQSGLFGRTSPPQLDLTQGDALSAEMEALRKEVRTVRDELEMTKHELSESNEAREASETCVKALREFIGENNVGAPETNGLMPLKLPPPPTMANGQEDEGKATGPAAWGFKLWKEATVRGPQSATFSPPVSVPVPVPQMPMSATPLSRKIGGFFSSRGSIGSSSSSSSNGVPLSLQTNAATTNGQRESMYSFSDTSSVAEPTSPAVNMVEDRVIIKN